VDTETLHGEALKQVDRGAVVITDELPAYRDLAKDFAEHRSVTHRAREYVRPDPDGLKVHTNTAESYFALLKRGHYGIFHHFSRRHTHRYCDEFSFRWNARKVSDGQRMVAAIKGVEGKRLKYREPADDIDSA
jgi:hypothetical protein